MMEEEVEAGPTQLKRRSSHYGLSILEDVEDDEVGGASWSSSSPREDEKSMEDAPRGDITSDVDRATKEIAIAHFQLTKELHDAIIKTPSDAILTARLQTYVSSEGKINGGSITSGGSRKISVRDVYFELKKHLGIDVTLAEFPDLLTALSLHVSEQDDCEGNGNVFWMRSKKEDDVASIDNELELEYLELFYTRGCVVFEELLLALDFLRQNETGPLALGSRVVKWRIMGKEPAYGANVCFLGPTHFALGIWRDYVWTLHTERTTGP